MANLIDSVNKQHISQQLNGFVNDLNQYTSEYENTIVDISENLPKMEDQIDESIKEANFLLKFVFSSESSENAFGVKHELTNFHTYINNALSLFDSSDSEDKIIFEELRQTIDTSKAAISKIKNIFNISENLKVFAINSIVYSQKEGTNGRGYQIISGEFIKLSEEIAKGTRSINIIRDQMDSEVDVFLELIKNFEEFSDNQVKKLSIESKELLKSSENSMHNFETIITDLLKRFNNVKIPIGSVMSDLQKQDIIHQQMVHLTEAVNDILVVLSKNSQILNKDVTLKSNDFEINESRNILTLLKFLLITTEKQMYRINSEILEMLECMERDFSLISDTINEINSDKHLFDKLIMSGGEKISSFIHKIFLDPKVSIDNIIISINESQSYKSSILKAFIRIRNLLSTNKDKTISFLPMFESVKNLLFLASVEQARNNLDIPDQDSLFSHDSFDELIDIISRMQESFDLVELNLEKVSSEFDSEDNNFSKIELDLNESVKILDKTEELFQENYNSVLLITDGLTEQVGNYNIMFKGLRLLHEDMETKINNSSHMRNDIERKLNKIGGALDLNDCHFKETIFQSILSRLTVDEERITIAAEFSEIEIEKSSGSDITFF
ncbi:MAG: methyl-accepting chemotaxis protein [Spirochaetaceae bacterium]